ncbi:MAG: single-stranded-DNA-specific exonuclease RecJ [Sedimentisphaerales bacterium]|nr:single-stranded-DNA-specific exonuclease RecJ [Sedimentisphaerales bacterium]
MLLWAQRQKKEWIIKPPDNRCDELARSLKVSPLIAQVLINRGITNSELGNAFLRPRLTELIEPERMPGIKNAVERIKKALKNREKITIYGDYDVDGITSVSILWQVLRLLGGDADYYIPHRIDEGYGLNIEAIESLAKSGTKLLITVDCGITAFESAELAEKLGIELIITDHHQIIEQENDNSHSLPHACAIVHPSLDNSYPNQDSAGSMVAFKLAWAIANEFSSGVRLQPQIREFMLSATSLAAMGTIADIVDLRGENRILTSFGLKALPDSRLSGIQALLETLGLTGQKLDSFHIGFRLAPMLNAAGRMGHARLAVELLTSESPTRSMQIAEYLKEQNEQRQKCERKILKEACEIMVRRNMNHPDRKSIVLAGENWHIGVIGIVASRIVDKYHRPTILLGLPSGQENAEAENAEQIIAQGSARSIPGFCMISGLKACSHLLNTFGGHKMAAGVTIESSKIEQFIEEFEAYAKVNLDEKDIISKLEIESVVPLSKFKLETVKELQMLGPFGEGNPEPVFATKGVRLASPPKRVGTNGDHLQLVISDNTATLRGIGFRFGKYEKKLLEREFFDIAYQPQINSFNGNTNVEFNLVDIQIE